MRVQELLAFAAGAGLVWWWHRRGAQQLAPTARKKLHQLQERLDEADAELTRCKRRKA